MSIMNETQPLLVFDFETWKILIFFCFVSFVINRKKIEIILNALVFRVI